MNNSLKYFFVMTVIIYVYIHNPFITFLGGIGSIAYLFPLTLLYLRDKDVRKLFSKNKDVIACSCGIIVYCAIKMGLGSDFGNFRQALYHFITTDILAIPIAVLIYRWTLKFDKVLVFNGFLAAIITVFCLISPSFNQIIKSILIETVDLWEKGQEGIRGFGLSNEFLYGYGLSLGIIISYAIYNNYIKKWWFIIYLMLCSLAILVNARTGMVIVVLSILLYFVFSPRSILNYGLLGMILVIIAIPIISFFIKDDSVIEFASDFFFVFQRLFVDGDVSDNGTLFDFTKMFVFPSNLMDWIFGTGNNLFGNEGEHSDIGFINQLYYGGILYLILLILLIYLLTKRIHNKYWKIMCWFIFVVSNFKGNMFMGCGNMRLFYLIIIYDYWARFKSENKYLLLKQK